MAQKFTEVPIPFTKMSFTPDVPSQALSAGEYNAGYNVEADVRGIRSVNGDEYLLPSIVTGINGNIIFLTSGYRNNGVFWFIMATDTGHWYACDRAGIINITPATGYINTYSANTTITSSWNGNVLFLNDNINPPMYLLSDAVELRLYDHGPDNYVWNYTPGWTSSTAGFVRLWSTPNVGGILIAGNITANLSNGTTENYPTTIQWSQAFGLNAGPTTWAPTLTNVANQLEVTVSGPVVDGFSLNGSFWLFSYWDCVQLNPMSYQSTSAPIIGIQPFVQSRGLLNANCWAVNDHTAYGIDSRDFWTFDGNTFVGLGNQRVRKYLFDNLNPAYTNQVFLVNNTVKQQIEIYYPDLNSTGGCNQMLSYRYDLGTFNPPRQVASTRMATESPKYVGTTVNDASRGIVYATHNQLVQKDTGFTFLGSAINSLFQRDNIQLLPDFSAQALLHRIYPEISNVDAIGLPVLPSTGNVTMDVGVSQSVGSAPTYLPAVTVNMDTQQPWAQFNQNAARLLSLRLSSSSSSEPWMATQLTAMLTQTQDNY
jgi:hypothetical protein